MTTLAAIFFLISATPIMKERVSCVLELFSVKLIDRIIVLLSYLMSGMDIQWEATSLASH